MMRKLPASCAVQTEGMAYRARPGVVGFVRAEEPNQEELAAMRADIKRQFDLTDEEADEAMRNICF